MIESYEDALEGFENSWKSGRWFDEDGVEKEIPDNEGMKYAEKYWIPTMEFFNKTKEEAWKDSVEYVKKQEENE